MLKNSFYKILRGIHGFCKTAVIKFEAKVVYQCKYFINPLSNLQNYLIDKLFVVKICLILLKYNFKRDITSEYY